MKYTLILYTLYQTFVPITIYVIYVILFKKVVIMSKTEEKVLLNLSTTLLKKIEDFQFENRISSRSEAIRQLIEKGLTN